MNDKVKKIEAALTGDLKRTPQGADVWQADMQPNEPAGPWLAPIPTTPYPATVPPTPMAMLAAAVEKGASVETLEKLMGLAERYERNMARRAFNAAMAAARADLPSIVKNREARFEMKAGGTKQYRYEDLPGIIDAISPVLAKHGLFFRWRTDSTERNVVKVTCILEHSDGYFEENTLSGNHDPSGNKGDLQALASAVTYLQRYTLKAAIGIAAGLDDDGHAAGGTNGSNEPVSAEQLAALQKLAEDVKANVAKFCGYFKVDSLAAIPQGRFKAAMDALAAKRAKA